MRDPVILKLGNKQAKKLEILVRRELQDKHLGNHERQRLKGMLSRIKEARKDAKN